MSNTEQKLTAARNRLERADAAWERTGPSTRDPGALSGIKGYNDTPAKVARNINRTTRAAAEGVAAAEEVKRLEHKLKREKRHQRIRDTAVIRVPIEDLQPGDRILYENYGSPENAGSVVRVNKKTVTIDAPEHFDKPKIDKARIIATMRPEANGDPE